MKPIFPCFPFTVRSVAPTLALTVSAMTCGATSAIADDRSAWQVKTHAIVVGSDETFEVDQSTSDSSNVHTGASLAVEYRVTNLIGLELGASTAKTPDIEGSRNGESFNYGDGPRFSPIWLGVNFHLLESNQWDIYAGPRVAFVNFGDFELDVDGQRVGYTVDNEIAYGATAGVAYQFGSSNWSLNAELTYLSLDMQVSERGGGSSTQVSFDPVTFGIGVGYRF